MFANMLYLIASLGALTILAKTAAAPDVLAAALALVAVAAVLASLSQGTDGLTSVIDALARLFHDNTNG